MDEFCTNLFSCLVTAKVPGKFVIMTSFQDFLLLVCVVDPSLWLAVLFTNKKQRTIVQDEVLRFSTYNPFLVFSKIIGILVIAKIVEYFIVRFRFRHGSQ